MGDVRALRHLPAARCGSCLGASAIRIHDSRRTPCRRESFVCLFMQALKLAGIVGQHVRPARLPLVRVHGSVTSLSSVGASLFPCFQETVGNRGNTARCFPFPFTRGETRENSVFPGFKLLPLACWFRETVMPSPRVSSALCRLRSSVLEHSRRPAPGLSRSSCVGSTWLSCRQCRRRPPRP